MVIMLDNLGWEKQYVISGESRLGLGVVKRREKKKKDYSTGSNAICMQCLGDSPYVNPRQRQKDSTGKANNSPRIFQRHSDSALDSIQTYSCVLENWGTSSLYATWRYILAFTYGRQGPFHTPFPGALQ